MSKELPEQISDADGHLSKAAQRAAESKPGVSGDDEDTLLKDDTPSLVRPGLYIGSLEAAANYSHLRSLDITHVLQVCRYHSYFELPVLTTPHPPSSPA